MCFFFFFLLYFTKFKDTKTSCLSKASSTISVNKIDQIHTPLTSHSANNNSSPEIVCRQNQHFKYIILFFIKEKKENKLNMSNSDLNFDSKLNQRILATSSTALNSPSSNKSILDGQNGLNDLISSNFDSSTLSDISKFKIESTISSNSIQLESTRFK
jgi:hypothetical protein